MLCTELIEHLKERVAEYGDHEVVFPDDTQVTVPEFNTDGDEPAFVLDHP